MSGLGEAWKKSEILAERRQKKEEIEEEAESAEPEENSEAEGQ